MFTAYHARVVIVLIVSIVSSLFSGNRIEAAPPSSSESHAPKDRPARMFPHQICKSLDEAIALAEDELKRDYPYGVAAIVYTINTPDDRMLPVNARLLFVGNSGGGYMPGKASTNGAILKPVIIRNASQPVELQITALGFEKYKRRAILRDGELLIWDDIVLTPITERTAAAVEGDVRLDNENDDVEGLVIYVDKEAVTFTDASGHFEADPVRSGKLHVYAYKLGYIGMHTDITVSKGYMQSCELVGYRKRQAHVRWAYQPDGTRNFLRNVQTGTDILVPYKKWQIRFDQGFKQEHRNNDFVIFQIKDKLVLRHWYSKGIPTQSILVDTAFNSLPEAPEAGYDRSEKTLHIGDVYVIRCHDGQHYAKIEVLDITDEPIKSNSGHWP